jgi:hypothetical protein
MIIASLSLSGCYFGDLVEKTPQAFSLYKLEGQKILGVTLA